VGLITNKNTLANELIRKGSSFSEIANSEINTTKLVANLINQGDGVIDGIKKIKVVQKGKKHIVENYEVSLVGI